MKIAFCLNLNLLQSIKCNVKNFLKFQLVEIENDGSLSLMEDDGHLKTDLNCPSNELGKEIKERYENGESLTVSLFCKTFMINSNDSIIFCCENYRTFNYSFN